MEKLNQFEDEAMENLLHRYIKRQASAETICKEFDPDIASLYIERVLTATETTRFETHLVTCHPCRKEIVSLSRLAQSELVAASTANHPAENEVVSLMPGRQASWLDHVKSLLLPLLSPKIALAAVAVLALAVSVPIYFSSRTQPATTPQTAQAPTAPSPSPAPSTGPTAQSETAAASGAATVVKPEVGEKSQAASGQTDASTIADAVGRQPQADAEGTKAPAVEPAPSAASKSATEVAPASAPPSTQVAAAPERKEEAAAKTATADERRADTSTPSEAAPSSQTAGNEARRLERIDPKPALRLPETDKDSGRSTTIKQGAPDPMIASNNKPERRVIRPGDDVPQPPPPTADKGKSKSITSPGGLSYRSSSDRAQRPTNLRKVSKKTFFLINDYWTDKDYKQDKELPVVTLVKDSDVYREVVARHSDLQKLFAGFAANERVLVVYKNTLYKLIPQDSDK